MCFLACIMYGNIKDGNNMYEEFSNFECVNEDVNLAKLDEIFNK